MISNDYRSWSFGDRAFLFAALVSVLWHLFWFFAVTVVVTPPARKPLVEPRMVVLGPVLDDAIFRTLVDTRPEISRAFYRPPSDFDDATGLPTHTVERYAPGDVVSVPAGKSFFEPLKDEMDGTKVTADGWGP